MRYRLTGPFKLKGKANYYLRAWDRIAKRNNWWSTGSRNRDVARALLLRYQLADAEGREPRALQCLTFADACAAWLKDMRATTSRQTVRTPMHMARAFWLPEFGRLPLGAITSRELADYLERRRVTSITEKKPHGLSATTLNNERKYLAALWNWAILNDHATKNPVKAVPRFSGEKKKRTRYISKEEERRLLEKCAEPDTKNGRTYHRPPWLHLLVLLAIRTGLRRGSLLALQWQDIDFNAGRWRIAAHKSKTREDYNVPIAPSVLAALLAHRGGEEIDPAGKLFTIDEESVKNPFMRACRRANLQLTFHDLRRCFINRAREAGIPIDVVMRLSSHRSMRTVMEHYREIADRDLESAVRSIDNL